MKNRKILTGLFTLSFATALGGIILCNVSNPKIITKAAIEEYGLTLNSSNHITTSGNHTIKTEKGNDVIFTYANVGSYSSGHVTLNNGGTLLNQGIITSITSFQAEFTGNLKARLSYDSSTWGDYFEINSTIKYDLGSNPYFIEFYAFDGATTIKSISYKYSCVANPNIDLGGGDYVRVTDPADLVVGSEIVFTNSSYNFAIGKKQNTNNREAVSIDATSESITTNENVAEFTLGKGKVANTYSFQDSNGYLYAASSSNNYLQSEETLSNNSSFKIIESSGNMIVTAQGSNTKNEIRFNLSSHIFSCYGSTSGVDAGIQIFQKEFNSTPVDEVGFIATHSNASNYKNYESFNDRDGLVVKSISSDGSQTILTSGFTYEIKNSSGNVIDPSEPFGVGGIYTLTVSYKNYIPQVINLEVSGGVYKPIVTIAVDNVSGTLSTSDTFANYLNENDDWGCIVEFEDEELDGYTYAQFAENNLILTLLNPSGVTHSISSPFGVDGNWKVRVTNALNNTVYGEAEFYVNIVPVETISLNTTSETLSIGETLQLSVSGITPTEATYKDVTWSSTNSTVASVSSTGLVTALQKGSTTIKATSVDSNHAFAECDIVVTAPSSTEYTFTAKDWSANPEDWNGSKDGNAFSNSGVQVTAGLSGIYATSPVQFNRVSKVTIGYCTNKSSGEGTISIQVGSTTIDSISTTTTGGTSIRYMEFEASTPLNGFVKLTVSCSESSVYICSCKIDVAADPVDLTDISISASKTSIAIGETTSLSAVLTPENATINSLNWSSSNSEVATVNNNGLVTGVSQGTAQIKCKAITENGSMEDSITITVNRITPTSVTLNKSELSLGINGSETLSATVLPANATNKNVTYSSSDSTVASVTNAGVVTGLKEGSATITVKTVEGNKTDTCAVTVSNSALSKTKIKETYNDYYKHSYYDEDHIPSVSNPKILVIPVWFEDSSTFINTSKKGNVRDDIQKAFFGTNEETGWRSVKTYYEELSGNKTSLSGVVSNWYEAPYESDEVPDTETTMEIVESATNWYFTNNPSDSRLNYDADGSGYLDGVVLVYGAPDYSKYTSLSENMWAYVFWMQKRNASISNPQVNNFLWVSYDTMYNSSKASSRAGSSYGGGDTSHCNIDAHTMIHESGHMFGLMDYYDYGPNSYKPAGSFSMQDYNVGSHDPFSAMALGWADPYIPTSTCTIDLHPFQSSHELILLTPDWNSYDSAFDEYILLELYTPTGLNELDSTYQYLGGYPPGPTTTGIRLWHVDARLLYVSGGYIYIDETTTTVGNVMTEMSNTYDTGGHGSLLAQYTGYEYYQYFNLLQLIRNDTSETYLSKNRLYGSDLFTNGSSFSMATFKNQFYYSGKLNSDESLGWSFSVSITGSGNNAVASVTCTKA